MKLARAAAFNDELSSELKTRGLPELTQSLLSISPAGEEDDGKCPLRRKDVCPPRKSAGSASPASSLVCGRRRNCDAVAETLS